MRGQRAAAPATLPRARLSDRPVPALLPSLGGRDRGLDVGEGELQLLLRQALRPPPELVALQSPQQVPEPVVRRLQRVPLGDCAVALGDGLEQQSAQDGGIVGERCGVDRAGHAESSPAAPRRSKRNLRPMRYPATCGRAVHAVRRQSMPSSSIDICAGVSETAPLVALGQTNLPRSSLLA